MAHDIAFGGVVWLHFVFSNYSDLISNSDNWLWLEQIAEIARDRQKGIRVWLGVPIRLTNAFWVEEWYTRVVLMTPKCIDSVALQFSWDISSGLHWQDQSRLKMRRHNTGHLSGVFFGDAFSSNSWRDGRVFVYELAKCHPPNFHCYLAFNFKLSCSVHMYDI